MEVYLILKQRNINKMSVKLLPLVLLITVEPCRSSLVIDSGGQKGLNLSDYCPNMKYCREGTHIMCMYQTSGFGPGCFSPRNKLITAELAGQILDVINAIRSKIALGKETGANGMALPRGYGIFRLKWDSELATFAQVMANQCGIKRYLCTATKRFRNPTPIFALVQFRVPHWIPYGPFKEQKEPGLTNSKLVWAITRTLQNWYSTKELITEEMIKICPNFYTLQTNLTVRPARSYLSLIQGSATHMGCGITGYRSYTFEEKLCNTLLVVCNLSADLRVGSESYETLPPIPGQGYSSKCGCPPGSEEDADCLCNEAKPPPPPEPTCPNGENSGNDCESTLVLLPIFTMEDAPTEKLYHVAEEIKDPLKNYILQRVDNTSNAIARQGNMGHTPSPLEMFDFFHENEGEAGLWQRAHRPNLSKLPAPSYTKLHSEPQASPMFRLGPDSEPPSPPPRRVPAAKPSPPARSVLRARLPPPPPPPRIPPPPPPGINLYTTSQKAHEQTRPAASHDKRSRPLPKPSSKRRGFTKKASIFTRVAQFQLPKRRSMSSSLKVIKKDVAPRKDFSNLNKVVNDYLKRRPGYKIIDNNHEKYKPTEEAKPRTEEKTEAVVIDTGLNKAEETVINFNQYLSQKNSSNYSDKEVDIKDDNDNRLLSLLDTLEREVKHIALDGSEKELFDAKIRKIYGSIVGKTALLRFPKPILLSTTDQETPEIDFGETKSSDKLEPDHEEYNHIKVSEEPKQPKRYQLDKGIERVRNSIPSIQGHKWKTKFIDSFDQKKYKENIDGFSYKKPDDTFDHKYDENLDHMYGDIDHKHMDDLDRKHNENINKKYSENHLDHEFKDDQVKLSDNFHHQHHYNLDKKYNADNELASRSSIKYEADRAVFREFEHSRSSQEDTSPRDFSYKDLKAINQGTPDVPLITKDREKRKKNERKHRNRVKSLNALKDPISPLSLERRKYYQEKLDNIKRKLRSRRNRGNNEPRNEQFLRRMHTKNREIGRTRTKSQADNFYMPERARFLHGF